MYLFTTEFVIYSSFGLTYCDNALLSQLLLIEQIRGIIISFKFQV